MCCCKYVCALHVFMTSYMNDDHNNIETNNHDIHDICIYIYIHTYYVYIYIYIYIEGERVYMLLVLLLVVLVVLVWLLVYLVYVICTGLLIETIEMSMNKR